MMIRLLLLTTKQFIRCDASPVRKTSQFTSAVLIAKIRCAKFCREAPNTLTRRREGAYRLTETWWGESSCGRYRAARHEQKQIPSYESRHVRRSEREEKASARSAWNDSLGGEWAVVRHG